MASKSTRFIKALEDYVAALPDGCEDVGIWTGKDIVKHTGIETAIAVLHYDGAGHDLLSYRGDGPYMGLHTYRNAVIALAARFGLEAQDENGWSTGFYPA